MITGIEFQTKNGFAVRGVVFPQTARAENVDGFHAMNGYTIAQTVAMKIEGFHAPGKDGKSPMHRLAVY